MSESPVGPAVRAAIRANLETCAVERGANISYETLVDEDVLGLGTDAGGDDIDKEDMVDKVKPERTVDCCEVRMCLD
jgi:hypothetical protein